MRLSLRQVTLVAPELAPAVEELCDVFGLAACERENDVAMFGLENALLPVGRQFIEIVAPTREGTAAGRYLERRGGSGGYMLIFQTDDPAARDRHIEALGVRAALRHADATMNVLQLHPKDTGGTFFEIDFQPGTEDDPDRWTTAGPRAKEARRTHRSLAIRGAEIQSPDPERLARRWAEIAGLPLEPGDGPPRLHVEDAEIGFVPCADGRPEGLGAIDLAVRERGPILEAARQRGLPVADGVPLVCGTRFHLLERG